MYNHWSVNLSCDTVKWICHSILCEDRDNVVSSDEDGIADKDYE